MVLNLILQGMPNTSLFSFFFIGIPGFYSLLYLANKDMEWAREVGLLFPLFNTATISEVWDFNSVNYMEIIRSIPSMAIGAFTLTIEYWVVLQGMSAATKQFLDYDHDFK